MRTWLFLLPLVGCSDGDKGSFEELPEICNGEDDDGDGQADEGFDDSDGDGLADCVDDACDLDLPAAGTVAISEDCEGAAGGDVEDAFNVEPEWSYSDGGGVIVMPAVGNLTDDNGDGVADYNDIPDIAVTTYSYTLVLLSGDSGEVIFELSGYDPYSAVAIADVDADGESEVVAVTSSYELTAVDGDGEVEWTSEAFSFTNFYPQPVVGDLEGDGVPEIVCDAKVVSGADGSTVMELEDPTSPYRTPIIADIDQDGVQEIILAENVYDADGNILWSGQLSTYGQFGLVAEIDGDEEAEVLMVTEAGAFLFEHDGEQIDRFYAEVTQAGVPCAADFDGDGTMDFGLPASDTLWVVNADGDGLWSYTIDDSSGLAGCSAFDLNADGVYELLFADQSTFYIFDGPTGELVHEDNDHASGTVWEYPVIADVDADGSAEVVVASNGGGAEGVRTYGQVNNGWPASGPTWGTHDFYVTNVLYDGSVPASPEPGWATYGLFRGRPAAEQLASADLVVELAGVCVSGCPSGTVSVGYQVYNQGVEDIDAGIPITLYAVGGGSTYTVETQTLDAIPAGTSLAGRSFDVAVSYFGPEGFVIRVDDDGEGGTSIRDCDRGNNDASYSEPLCGGF